MWLSSSIAKWIFEVHSHHAAVRQLSQGIRVGSDRAMEAALRWWRQAAVLYQYDVQLLSASIARLTSAQSVWALAQWRRHATDMSSLRRAASRLLSQQMARVLGTWVSLARARADATEVARAALARLVNQQLSMAWRSRSCALSLLDR